MAKKKTGLAAILTDRFMDVWKLLSETTVFLSRIPEFSQYEDQLRAWRGALQKTSSAETSQKIRGEIAELRKNLRYQGYDLSLGGQALIIDGFRNDLSSREGFRRVVLFICAGDILWISGEENHITLSEHLEARIQDKARNQNPGIKSKHYLWYKRRGPELILSGADTETKEDFERLRAMAEANTLFFLAKLKNLK